MKRLIGRSLIVLSCLLFIAIVVLDSVGSSMNTAGRSNLWSDREGVIEMIVLLGGMAAVGAFLINRANLD